LKVSSWLAGAARHCERVEDQAGAHMSGQLPADHTPAEHVDHERQVDQATRAPISLVDVADIARVAAQTLTSGGEGGEIYAITGPEALTYHQAGGGALPRA